MNEVSLKESDISRMKKYPLDGIISTEAKIYYYKHNKNNTLLLKKLYNTDKKRVDRKVDTLDNVYDSELVEYKELVFPRDVVTFKGIKSGFIIDEVVDSVNLYNYLNSRNISRDDKLSILKKIGKLLEKVQTSNKEFYFGDLQSYNFLVDKKDNIYAVDLDSSSTCSDDLLETKYICLDEKTYDVLKYNVCDDGRCHPSQNVDLYCYNTLVFNYLSGIGINKLDFSDYYDYVGYLEKCGIPSEMVDIYLYLYSEKDNRSVSEYLDHLPSDYGRVNYNVYSALKKIRK